MEIPKLQNELKGCLKQLRENGADVLAIACNTLHVFLNVEDELEDLIRLPQIIAAQIPKGEKPLVLCTSTSRQYGLHKQFFPCVYPDAQTQGEVDVIIEKILKNVDRNSIVNDLLGIVQTQIAKTIVLGCTELSLFSEELSSANPLIIDPLEVSAIKIVQTIFKNKRG
jgi:aspartate racemase